MTDLLSRVVLQRADEQTRDVSMLDFRDPWRLPDDRTAKKVKAAKPSRPCLAGDCDRPVRESGYCWMHLRRIRRHGTVDEMIRPSVLVKKLRRLDFLRRAA